MQKHPIILWRLFSLIAVIIFLAFACYWLSENGVANFPLQCFFHEWTGLHCPGCGMTRATYALLHGELTQAFSYNILGIIILPLALIGIGLELIGWLRNTAPPFRCPLGSHGAKIIAIIFILFFILRNLPWYPFNLLAP